jgi:hypothetical protein
MTAPTERCPATVVSRKSTKRKVKIRAARLIWAFLFLAMVGYALLYRKMVMGWFYHTEYFPDHGGVYTINPPNCADQLSTCELPESNCLNETCPAFVEDDCPAGLNFSLNGFLLKAFSPSICKLCPGHDYGKTCAKAVEEVYCEPRVYHWRSHPNVLPQLGYEGNIPFPVTLAMKAATRSPPLGFCTDVVLYNHSRVIYDAAIPKSTYPAGGSRAYGAVYQDARGRHDAANTWRYIVTGANYPTAQYYCDSPPLPHHLDMCPPKSAVASETCECKYGNRSIELTVRSNSIDSVLPQQIIDSKVCQQIFENKYNYRFVGSGSYEANFASYAKYRNSSEFRKYTAGEFRQLNSTNDVGFYYLEGSGEELCGEDRHTSNNQKQCGVFISRSRDPFTQRWVMYNNVNTVPQESGGSCNTKCANEKIGKLLYVIDDNQANELLIPPSSGWITADAANDAYIVRMKAFSILTGADPAPTVEPESTSCNTVYKNATIDRVWRTRYNSDRLPFKPLHIHAERCHVYFRQGTKCMSREKCGLAYSVIGETGVEHEQHDTTGYYAIKVVAPLIGVGKNLQFISSQPCILEIIVPYKEEPCTTRNYECYRDKIDVLMPDTMISGSAFTRRTDDTGLAEDTPMYEIRSFVPLNFGAQKLVIRGDWRRAAFKALKVGVLDVHMVYGNLQIMQLQLMHTTVRFYDQIAKLDVAQYNDAQPCEFPFTAYWPDGTRSIHTECSSVTAAYPVGQAWARGEFNDSAAPPRWCSTKPYYMRFDHEKKVANSEVGDWGDWQANENYCDSCYDSTDALALEAGIADSNGVIQEMMHEIHAHAYTRWNIRTRGVRHLHQAYRHVPNGCVIGQNIVLFQNLTVDQCEYKCNRNIECVAFEYGVAYGGTQVLYNPHDCQLQSFYYDDMTKETTCNGTDFDLDLYVKVSTLPVIYELRECTGNGGNSCAAVGESATTNMLDCQAGTWGGWSACSKTCGHSTRHRTRKITQTRQKGGKQCPHLHEHQQCQRKSCMRFDTGGESTLYWNHWGFCGYGNSHANGSFMDTVPSIYLGNGDAWINVVEDVDVQTETYKGANCFKAPVLKVDVQCVNATNTTLLDPEMAEFVANLTNTSVEKTCKTLATLRLPHPGETVDLDDITCHKGCRGCLCTDEDPKYLINPDLQRPIMNITAPNGAVYMELIKCSYGFNDDMCASYDSSTTPYYDSKRDPNPGSMQEDEHSHSKEMSGNKTTPDAVVSYKEQMEMSSIESLSLLKFTEDSEAKLSLIQRDVQAQQGRDVIVLSEVDAPGMNFGKFMFATMKPYVYMPFPPLIMAFSASLMAPVVMRKRARIVPGMCPVIDMRYWSDIDDDTVQRIGYISDLFNRTINVGATQRLTLLTQSSGSTPSPSPSGSGVSWLDPAILWDPVFGKQRWISLYFSKSVKWSAQKLLLWDNFYYLLIVLLSLVLAFAVGLIGGFISLVLLLREAIEHQLRVLDKQADKVKVLHSEAASRDPSKSPLEVMQLAPGVRATVEGEKVMVHQLGMFYNAKKEIPISWLQKGGRYANSIGHVNIFQLINTTLGGLMNMSSNSTEAMFSAMEIHHVRPDIDFEPVSLRNFVEEYEAFCNRHNMTTRSLQTEEQLKILQKHSCMVQVMESDEIAGYEYLKMKELDVDARATSKGEDEDGGNEGKKKGPKESAPARFLSEMYQKTTFAANFVQLIELQEEYDRYCVINSIPEDERKDLKTSDNEFQAFGAVFNPAHKLYEITGIAKKSEIDDLNDTQADSAPHPGLVNIFVVSCGAGVVVAALHLGMGVAVWPLALIVPGAAAASLLIFDSLQPQYFWLFLGATSPLIGTMVFLTDEHDILPGGGPGGTRSNTGFFLWYILHCACVLPPLVGEFAKTTAWLANFDSYHDDFFDKMMMVVETKAPVITSVLSRIAHTAPGMKFIMKEVVILLGSNLGFYILSVLMVIATMAAAGPQNNWLLLYYSIPAVLAMLAGNMHMVLHRMRSRVSKRTLNAKGNTDGDGPQTKVPFRRARKFLNLIRVWVPTQLLLTVACAVSTAYYSKASNVNYWTNVLLIVGSTVIVWYRGKHTCVFAYPDCSYVKIHVIKDATSDDTMKDIVQKNLGEMQLQWKRQLLMLLTSATNTFYLRQLILVIADLLFVLLVPSGPLCVVMYAETSKHIYSPYADSSLSEFYFTTHAPSTKWSNEYIVLPSWVDELEFYALVIWGITLAYYIWGLLEFIFYCLAWDLSQPFMPRVWTGPRILLHSAFTYFSVFFGALSISYLVLVSIWLVLAAVLNPNRFLAICVMTITTVGFASAKIKMLKRGQDNITDMVKVMVMKNFGDRAKDSVIGQKTTKAVGEDTMDDLVQGDLKGPAAQQLEKRLKMPAEVIEGLMAGNLEPLKVYACEKYQADPVVIDGLVAVALADMAQLSIVANTLGERFNLPNRMASNFIGLHATLALPADQQQAKLTLIIKDLVLGAFPSINPHVIGMIMGLPMNQPSEFLSKASDLVRNTAMRAMYGGKDTSGFERFIAQIVGCGIAIPKASLGLGKWLKTKDHEQRASILEGLEACFRDIFSEFDLPPSLASVFCSFMSSAASTHVNRGEKLQIAGSEAPTSTTDAAKVADSADQAAEMMRRNRHKIRLMMEELVQQTLPNLDAALISAVSEIGDGNPAPMLQLLGIDRSVYDLGMSMLGVLAKARKSGLDGGGGESLSTASILGMAQPLMEAAITASKAPAEVLHIARLAVKMASASMGEKVDKSGIGAQLVPLLSKHILSGMASKQKTKLAEKLLKGALMSIAGETEPETSVRGVLMSLVTTVIDAQLLSVGIELKGHTPIGTVTVSGLANRLVHALEGVSKAEAFDINGENLNEPNAAAQIREVIVVLQDMATVLYQNPPEDAANGNAKAERVVEVLILCLDFMVNEFDRASVAEASKLAPIMAGATSCMIPVVMYSLGHEFLSAVTRSQQQGINMLMGKLQRIERQQTKRDFPRLKSSLRMLRVIIDIALKIGLKRYGEVAHSLLSLLDAVGIRFDVLNIIKKYTGMTMNKKKGVPETLGVALVGVSAPDISSAATTRQLQHALAAAVYLHLERNNTLVDNFKLTSKKAEELGLSAKGPSLHDVPKNETDEEFYAKVIDGKNGVTIEIERIDEILFEITNVTFTWQKEDWSDKKEYSLLDALEDPGKMMLFEDDVAKYTLVFEELEKKFRVGNMHISTMGVVFEEKSTFLGGGGGVRSKGMRKEYRGGESPPPSSKPRTAMTSADRSRQKSAARPLSGRHLSATAQLQRQMSPWVPDGEPRGLKFVFVHGGHSISEEAIVLIDCCHGRVQSVRNLIVSICATSFPQLSPDLLNPLLEMVLLLFKEEDTVGDQSIRWRQVVAILMEQPLTVTIKRAIELALPAEARERMLSFVPLLTSGLLQYATKRDIHHVVTVKTTTTMYSMQVLASMRNLAEYAVTELSKLILSMSKGRSRQSGDGGSGSSKSKAGESRVRSLLSAIIKLIVDARDCGPMATGPTLSKQARLQVALRGLYRFCMECSDGGGGGGGCDLALICMDSLEMVLESEVHAKKMSKTAMDDMVRLVDEFWDNDGGGDRSTVFDKITGQLVPMTPAEVKLLMDVVSGLLVQGFAFGASGCDLESIMALMLCLEDGVKFCFAPIQGIINADLLQMANLLHVGVDNTAFELRFAELKQFSRSLELRTNRPEIGMSRGSRRPTSGFDGRPVSATWPPKMPDKPEKRPFLPIPDWVLAMLDHALSLHEHYIGEGPMMQSLMKCADGKAYKGEESFIKRTHICQHCQKRQSEHVRRATKNVPMKNRKVQEEINKCREELDQTRDEIENFKTRVEAHYHALEAGLSEEELARAIPGQLGRLGVDMGVSEGDVLRKMQMVLEMLRKLAKRLINQVSNLMPKILRQIMQLCGITDEDLLKKAISSVLPFMHAFFSSAYNIENCLKPGGRKELRESAKVAAQQIMQQILARFMNAYMLQLEVKTRTECLTLLEEVIPLPANELEKMMVFLKPLVGSLVQMIMTGSKNGVTMMANVFKERVKTDLLQLLWNQEDVVQRLLSQEPMHFPQPLTQFLLAFLCKRKPGTQELPGPTMQEKAAELMHSAKRGPTKEQLTAAPANKLPSEAADALRDIALALIDKMGMTTLFMEVTQDGKETKKVDKEKIEKMSGLLEELVGTALQKDVGRFVAALGTTLSALASGGAKALQKEAGMWLEVVSSVISGGSLRKVLDLLAIKLQIPTEERETVHECVHVAFHTISIIKQLRKLAAGADMTQLRELLVQTMLMLLNPETLMSEQDHIEKHLATSANEAQRATKDEMDKAEEAALVLVREKTWKLWLGMDIINSFVSLAISQKEMAVQPLASAMENWLELPQSITIPLLDLAMSQSGHEATLGSYIPPRREDSLTAPAPAPLVSLLASTTLKKWLLRSIKLVVTARDHSDIKGAKGADKEAEDHRDEWFMSAIEVLCTPLEFSAANFRANVKMASGADKEVPGQCIAHLNALKRIASTSSTAGALNNPSWRKASKEFLMVMSKRFQLHDEDLGLLRCLINGDIIDKPEWEYDLNWIADLRRYPPDVHEDNWDGRTAKVQGRDAKQQSVEKWFVGQIFKILTTTCAQGNHTPTFDWVKTSDWKSHFAQTIDTNIKPPANKDEAIKRCARLIVAPFFVPELKNDETKKVGERPKSAKAAMDGLRETAKAGKSELQTEASTLLAGFVPVALAAKLKDLELATNKEEFKIFMESDIISLFASDFEKQKWMLELLRGLLGKLFFADGDGSLFSTDIWAHSDVFKSVLGAINKLDSESNPSMVSRQFGKIIPYLMNNLPVDKIVNLLTLSGFKVIDSGNPRTKNEDYEIDLKGAADKARIVFSSFYKMWISLSVDDDDDDSGPRGYVQTGKLGVPKDVTLPKIKMPKISLANAVHQVYEAMMQANALGEGRGTMKDALEEVRKRIERLVEMLGFKPDTEVRAASAQQKEMDIFNLHSGVCQAMASSLESLGGVDIKGLQSGVAAAAMLGAVWDIVCSQVSDPKPPSLLKLFLPMIELWQGFFSSLPVITKLKAGSHKRSRKPSAGDGKPAKTDSTGPINQLSQWALARDWASLLPEQVWDAPQVPAQCFGWECIDSYEERWFKVSFPGARALVVNLDLMQPKKSDIVIAEITLHDWENDVGKLYRGKQLLPPFVSTTLCGPVTDQDIDGDGRSFKRVTKRLLRLETDEMWVHFRSRLRPNVDRADLEDEPQNLTGFRMWVWPNQATAAQKREKAADTEGSKAIETWYEEHLYKEDLNQNQEVQEFTLVVHGEKQHQAKEVVSIPPTRNMSVSPAVQKTKQTAQPNYHEAVDEGQQSSYHEGQQARAREDALHGISHDDSSDHEVDEALRQTTERNQPANEYDSLLSTAAPYDGPTLNPRYDFTRAAAPDAPNTNTPAQEAATRERKLHYEWVEASREDNKRKEKSSLGDNNGLYVNVPDALVLAIWFEIDGDANAMEYFHQNYELHIFKDMSESDRWAELPYQNARVGNKRNASSFVWPIRGQRPDPRPINGPPVSTANGSDPNVYFQRLIIPKNSFWATVVQKEKYDPWSNVGGAENAPVEASTSEIATVAVDSSGWNKRQTEQLQGKKRGTQKKPKFGVLVGGPPKITIRMKVKDVKLFGGGFPLYWIPQNISVPSSRFVKWKAVLELEILLRRSDPVYAKKLQSELYDHAIDFLAMVQLDDDEQAWEQQVVDKDNTMSSYPESKIKEFQGHILAIATSVLTRDLYKTQQCVFWALEMAADMPRIEYTDGVNKIKYTDEESNTTVMRFASAAVAYALLNGRVAPGTGLQDIGGMLNELVLEFFPPDSGTDHARAGLVSSVLACFCDAIDRGLGHGTSFAMLSELAHHAIDNLCKFTPELVRKVLRVAGVLGEADDMDIFNSEKEAESQHGGAGRSGTTNLESHGEIIAADEHEDKDIVKAKKDAVLNLLGQLLQVAGAATRQAMHEKLAPPTMREGLFTVEENDVGDGQLTLSADSLFATVAFPRSNVGNRGKWYFEVKLIFLEQNDMDDNEGKCERK